MPRWVAHVINIKMDPREIGYKDVSLIELSQNRMKEIFSLHGVEPCGFGQDNLSAAWINTNFLWSYYSSKMWGSRCSEYYVIFDVTSYNFNSAVVFETVILLFIGSGSSLLTSCDVMVVTQVCHATMAGNQVQGCQYNGTGCLKVWDGNSRKDLWYVRVFLKCGSEAHNISSSPSSS